MSRRFSIDAVSELATRRGLLVAQITDTGDEHRRLDAILLIVTDPSNGRSGKIPFTRHDEKGPYRTTVGRARFAKGIPASLN
jgi:hypothetical protein